MNWRIWWEDGIHFEVGAENGTAAKAAARAQRGLRKHECKITRVEPVASIPWPNRPTDQQEQTQA